MLKKKLVAVVLAIVLTLPSVTAFAFGTQPSSTTTDAQKNLRIEYQGDKIVYAEGSDKWTDASWTAFVDAYTAAQVTLANVVALSISIEDIDAANEALAAAVKALAPKQADGSTTSSTTTKAPDTADPTTTTTTATMPVAVTPSEQEIEKALPKLEADLDKMFTNPNAGDPNELVKEAKDLIKELADKIAQLPDDSPDAIVFKTGAESAIKAIQNQVTAIEQYLLYKKLNCNTVCDPAPLCDACVSLQNSLVNLAGIYNDATQDSLDGGNKTGVDLARKQADLKIHLDDLQKANAALNAAYEKVDSVRNQYILDKTLYVNVFLQALRTDYIYGQYVDQYLQTMPDYGLVSDFADTCAFTFKEVACQIKSDEINELAPLYAKTIITANDMDEACADYKVASDNWQTAKEALYSDISDLRIWCNVIPQPAKLICCGVQYENIGELLDNMDGFYETCPKPDAVDPIPCNP